MNARSIFACINALDNAIALSRAGHRLDEQATSQLENARLCLYTESCIDDDGNQLFRLPDQIAELMEALGFKRPDTQYCFSFVITSNGFVLEAAHDEESEDLLKNIAFREKLETVFGEQLEEDALTGWVWLSYVNKMFSFDIHTRTS